MTKLYVSNEGESVRIFKSGFLEQQAVGDASLSITIGTIARIPPAASG